MTHVRPILVSLIACLNLISAAFSATLTLPWIAQLCIFFTTFVLCACYLGYYSHTLTSKLLQTISQPLTTLTERTTA